VPVAIATSARFDDGAVSQSQEVDGRVVASHVHQVSPHPADGKASAHSANATKEQGGGGRSDVAGMKITTPSRLEIRAGTLL